MAAVLAGIWQSFLLLSIGALCLRWIALDLRRGQQIALAVGFGAVCTSILIFAILLAGFFVPGIAIPSFLFLTFLSAPSGWRLLRECSQPLLGILRENLLMSILAVVLLLPQLLSALTPEVEVDSLWYHLGVPQFYLHRGELCRVPFILPSHYPMNFHLQYVFSLLVGNDITAKIVIAFLLLPICALLYSTVRNRADSSSAMLAVILYLSIIHHRIPVMANVQRAVLLFTLLSTVFLWRWLHTKDNRCFWISAFWCGIAMGTKLNALIFCLTLHSAVIAVWFLLKYDWKNLALRLIGYNAVAWVLFSPWMIKSYVFTGNPLYPLLSGVFGARNKYLLQAMHSNERNHGMNFLRSDSAAEYMDQVLHNINWMLNAPDLLFCLAPFVLLLLSVEYKRFRPAILTGLMTFPLFTFLWGSDVGRLFALTYGMFSILTGSAFFILREKTSIGKYLFWVLAIAVPATFLVQKATYCNYPAIDWHGDIHISQKSRIEYLLDHDIFTREDLRVMEFIEKNLSDDHNLYVYHGGYPFYLDFPKILSDAHFGEILDQWLLDLGPEETAKRFREMNIGYLLKGPKGVWKRNKERGGPPERRRERFNDFMDRYGSLMKQFENQQVYRFRWVERQS